MRLFTVLLLAALCACSSVDTAPPQAVRIVLFGDSNTDMGIRGSTIVAFSYVSGDPARPSPYAPNDPTQVSGKIERLWPGAEPLRVVNHAIGGTNTTNTLSVLNGQPNARYTQDGVTRFEAEVLGRGRLWTFNNIPRVQAFTPTAGDFVYVSLGTNDCRYGATYDGTTASLGWMIDQWKAAGLPASHFILATIPPTSDSPTCATDLENAKIRSLVAASGATLLDLSRYLSDDDGLSWRNTEQTIDGTHYTEPVREWIAERIIEIITH
jgi:lysophospholipase L1-like esterase